MRYVVMTMIMILSSATLSAAHPEGLVGQRDSLHGLSGVQLVVESIKPDAEGDGFSTNAIQTAAEAILQSSSIWLLSGPERIRMPSAPYLYVNVNTVNSDRDFYSFSVVTQLNQLVSLLTAEKNKTYATTWSRESTGHIRADELPGIVHFVEEHIKQFADDFLDVNPR